MNSGIITIAANFIFAYYLCGTDRFHGCSAQIVPQEKVYSRRKYGKSSELMIFGERK